MSKIEHNFEAVENTVNVANIERLADFIESNKRGWNYNNCSLCYLGQCAALLGTVSSVTDPLKDVDRVAAFLGLNVMQAHTLCFTMGTDNYHLPRRRAVSILRELAATGCLPTKTEAG